MKKSTGLFNRIRSADEPGYLESAFILDFLISREQSDVTRMTDLVQRLEFGTGPTVQRKVRALVAKNLVSLTPTSRDARARAITVTESGKNWLRELERKILA